MRKQRANSRKSKRSGTGTKGRSSKRGQSTSALLGGSRVGSKRSDLRFKAPDGSEWASPFEYKVYRDLDKGGMCVRRTTESDAISYTSPVKQGRCATCNSCEVVQDRTYTPDLVVDWKGPEKHREVYMTPIYLEVKGYFPGPKRNLFRTARSQHPELDIRLIASSDHWVTKGKTRLSDWARRFRIPFHVWNGALPEDWV